MQTVEAGLKINRMRGSGEAVAESEAVIQSRVVAMEGSQEQTDKLDYFLFADITDNTEAKPFG